MPACEMEAARPPSGFGGKFPLNSFSTLASKPASQREWRMPDSREQKCRSAQCSLGHCAMNKRAKSGQATRSAHLAKPRAHPTKSAWLRQPRGQPLSDGMNRASRPRASVSVEYLSIDILIAGSMRSVISLTPTHCRHAVSPRSHPQSPQRPAGRHRYQPAAGRVAAHAGGGGHGSGHRRLSPAGQLHAPRQRGGPAGALARRGHAACPCHRHRRAAGRGRRRRCQRGADARHHPGPARNA